MSKYLSKQMHQQMYARAYANWAEVKAQICWKSEGGMTGPAG
jgi:hypothetical protein